MQISVKVKRVVEEEKVYEVDSRINEEYGKDYQIANIIVNGQLSKLDSNLYHDEEWVVRDAVDRINDAFKTADAILNFLRDGGLLVEKENG